VNNVSGALAFFLSNAAALALRRLPREAQLSWGWRVPFLLALPLGIISVVLRGRLKETEAFKQIRADLLEKQQQAQEQQQQQQTAPGGSPALEEGVARERPADNEPPVQGFLAFLRATLIGVGVIAAINSSIYLPIYLANWVQKACGFSATLGLMLSAATKLTQILMTLPASFLGDRIGATKTMLIGGVLSALLVLPGFLLVLAVAEADPAAAGGGGPSARTVTVTFVVLALVLPIPFGLYNIPCPLFMTSLFPAEHRGRGAGIGLGAASMAGGFTPFICSLLASQHQWYPGLFVTLLTVPSLLLLLWSRAAAARGVLQVYQRAWLF